LTLAGRGYLGKQRKNYKIGVIKRLDLIEVKIEEKNNNKKLQS